MSAASTIARVSDNNFSGDLLSSTMASTSTSASTSHFSSGVGVGAGVEAAMGMGMSTLGIVGAAAAAAGSSSSQEEQQRHPSPSGWRNFKIGDHCDARDRGWEWTECEIIAVQGRRIRVHFVGWSSEWDTWFDKDSRDLAVLHSRSRRGGEGSSLESGILAVATSGSRRESEIGERKSRRSGGGGGSGGRSGGGDSSSSSSRSNNSSIHNNNNIRLRNNSSNENTHLNTTSPVPVPKTSHNTTASPATPERLQKPVRKWRLADVTFWIEQHLELPKAISEAFRANSISGDLLSTLEESDLINELGIDKRLHRRKILLSLKMLKGGR